MRASEAADWLRDELRDDLESVRSDPWWWATGRSVLEGWFGLALLWRQTVHNLVYGARTADDPQTRETTLRYTRCHVVSAGEATGHWCRFVTAMSAVGVAAFMSPVLAMGQAPAVAAFLVSNWALLVADPFAPLFETLFDKIRP